jgi:hypothetical protein
MPDLRLFGTWNFGGQCSKTMANFYHQQFLHFASVEDSLLLSAKLCGKAVIQVGHLPLFQVLGHLKHIQLKYSISSYTKALLTHEKPGHM